MAAALRTKFLVEGTDDRNVIGQLLLAHGSLGHDEFDFNKPARGDEGGFEWLLRILPAELENNRDRSLIIVVDADDDAPRRLAQVTHVVGKSGGRLEPTLEGAGSLGQAPNGQPLGLWLMPDHQQPGMLEDAFAALAFVRDDQLWPLAASTVDQLPLKQFNREIKAKVHTWLAWQEHPGRPMGISIKANPGQAQSDGMSAFLRFVEAVVARAE